MQILLYISLKRAEVIGFEPVRHIFELGLENISLNEYLKDQITFVNKAVGIKKGQLELTAQTIESYIDTDTYAIEVTTLPDIFNEYDFTPDILKMDCEGCEFEIILNYNFKYV